MSTPAWRLIVSNAADGATNMAVDEAVLLTLARGEAPPTLRFYEWAPPCLSLGCFQSRVHEIDVEACRRASVDCVRRPTGGRAVLHQRELTYSVTASASAGSPLAGSVSESYRGFSEALALGLRRLGVQAQLQPAREHARGEMRTAACFDAPSDYELCVGGRKLVGSAQVRAQGAVLQHGAVALDLDVGLLVSLFRLSGEDRRERLRASLASKATSLCEALGRPVSADEVRVALVAGIEERLGVRLTPGALSPAEEALAARLRAEKYATEEWNGRK